MQYVIGSMLAGLGVLALAVGQGVGREQEVLAAHGAELDVRCQSVLGRCEQKFHTAAALLNGEIDVEAAVGRFADVLGGEPPVVARLREDRPGMSDRELALRQLVKSVRAVGRFRSPRAEALARDLEAEADRLSATAPSVPTARVVYLQ